MVALEELWAQINQLVLALAYYAIMLVLLVPLLLRYRNIAIVAAFYIGSYVMSQYLSPKFTYFLGWVVPNGNFCFVSTVALMDAIVVTAGLSFARQVIYAGFLVQVLLMASNALVAASPSPEWVNEEALNSFLLVSGRVAVASPIAYLACELTNAYVTHKYRRVWWARTVYSDPLAMLIDTLVFVPLAFYGEVERGTLVDMVLGLTAVKLSFIPLNLMAVYVFRRAVEGLITQSRA